MKKLIGSVAIFVVTFLLLSINLKNKPVFNHIYTYSSPLTQTLQEKVEYIVKFGFDGGKAFGSKIFHNSIPHQKSNSTFRDSIDPLEDISKKDQIELEELIKK